MLILIEERTSEQLIFATHKVHCYIHIEFTTFSHPYLARELATLVTVHYYI